MEWNITLIAICNATKFTVTSSRQISKIILHIIQQILLILTRQLQKRARRNKHRIATSRPAAKLMDSSVNHIRAHQRGVVIRQLVYALAQRARVVQRNAAAILQRQPFRATALFKILRHRIAHRARQPPHQ